MVLPPLIPDKHPELTAWRPQGVLQGLRGGVGVRYTGRSFDGADTLVTPSTTLGDLMLGYTLRHQPQPLPYTKGLQSDLGFEQTFD